MTSLTWSLFTDDEEQQTLDPVVRFLKFKAFTNPHYLTLDTLGDKKLQIKRVFRLGEHAKILAESFPEHSVEYLQLREHLKKYARDLLDECSNSQEVEELLEDTGGGGQGRRDSLFDEALHKEQKPFVAHAYFQHVLRNCLEVGMGYNSRSHFIKKACNVLSVLFAFLLYPIVILVDSVCREGTILFESPEELRARRDRQRPEDEGCGCVHACMIPESGFWRFFRTRMHCPTYRIWTHAFCEIVFISLLYISLSKPRQQNEDPTSKSQQIIEDFAMYSFVLNYLINDIVEIARRSRMFFSSFWNVYTLLANIVLLSGGAMTFIIHKFRDQTEEYVNRAKLPGDGQQNILVSRIFFCDITSHPMCSGDDPLSIAVTLISFGAILYCFRTTRWFLLHKRVGPVIICFLCVLKDVIYVFLVWVVVYLSFALGIWLLYKPFQAFGKCDTEYCVEEKLVVDNQTMQGVLSKMFWIVFDGDGSDQRIQHKSALNATAEFSKEFSHPVGLSLWAMYQGIVVILLLNILIAMMNNTYMRIWANVDTEWKFAKTHFQVLLTTSAKRIHKKHEH